MPRRLLDRNIAILVAVVLASQLLTVVLAYALVLRPQTERIAEVTATMADAVSRTMADLTPAQRAAMIAQINAGDAIRIEPVSQPPSDGRRFPTLVERAFMAALARHLAPADLGGQQRLGWRTDAQRRLWVQLDLEHRAKKWAPVFSFKRCDNKNLERADDSHFALPALGGQPYWITINAGWARGPMMSMMLALITSVIAAIAAGVLLQRHLDRPLRRLALALDAYGAQGSGAPLAEEGPEEIAAAARALNRMTERLTRQEAERALLLAAVSHDLRTPLTRLRLALEMMHGEEADLTDSAGRQVDRIEAMLNQFLDFARGFEAEAPVPTLVAALIAGVVADSGGVAVVDVAPGLTANIRPSAISRALANLLGNARRHGAAPVTIAAWAADDALEIAICDGGAGFPPDQAEALCRPFARGDAARGGEGSGLGLAIVQRIVEAHGGTLGFAKAGGCFAARITLPAI